MVGKKTGMKSDVYSFGIILWEMYTEKVPYNNRFRSFNGNARPNNYFIFYIYIVYFDNIYFIIILFLYFYIYIYFNIFF